MSSGFNYISCFQVFVEELENKIQNDKVTYSFTVVKEKCTNWKWNRKTNKFLKKDAYFLVIQVDMNAYHVNWISDFPLSNSNPDVGISTHINTCEVEAKVRQRGLAKTVKEKKEYKNQVHPF